MSEITKSMIRSALGELNINVGIYKNKINGKLGAMVDSVNNHRFLYNASVWERQEELFVECTDRIRESIVNDLDKDYS